MPDLFSILCTTCKTKLRVRDQAVVGQILACPKCSSMVLVEPPPGWAPPHPGKAPSATPDGSNENGSGNQESAILKKPASAPPPKPTAKAASAPAAPRARQDAADPASMKETVSDSHFADVEALFGGDASKPAPAGVAQAARSKAKPPEGSKIEKRRNTPAPPPPAEMTTAPAAATHSSKPAIDPVPGHTKRARLIALLTIGGLLGISLAISAAYFAVSWNSKPKEVAEVPVASETAPVKPVKPEEEPTEKGSSEPSNEPPAEPMEVNTAPPEPPSEGPAETTEPQPQRDPLNIINDKPPEEEPADIAKLKDQLKGLDSDMGPMPVEGAATEETPESPASTEGPPPPSSRSRPEPREIDLAARLADPMLEVEFTGQKLSDVLQFLSDFSTIPITLDPDALPWSKITPAAPVHAKLVNTTVEEVLTEVLKPFRLEAQKLPDQIVVTRSAAVRTIKCPIDDLTGGDAARAQQLIEIITALAAPETWKSAGGVGSLSVQGKELVVENTEPAFGEVLHVCERLRQARGGRIKSVFPEELFALERRTARAAAKLDQPLTLNFGQPTLLVKILDRLAEETGTQILVDWQAAGEIGWPPDCDATVTLERTPLRDALQKLLGPMDLTFRVIDAKTIQVTTPKSLESKPEIEAYQASDLAASPDDAKTLLQRITDALGDDPLRWDAPSKTLLARLPQPDQEKLAALLAQWREEAAAK
jgi:hypothetical protein